jgi:hypothetical protein
MTCWVKVPGTSEVMKTRCKSTSSSSAMASTSGASVLNASANPPSGVSLYTVPSGKAR